MKLTNTNIDELYKFTKKHYVYYYDVQTELVDHLANDIEEIWVAQPLLTFVEARDASFKKFGVFGFMGIIESRQKVMNKRYVKILWRFFKEWFTLPKLVITLSIFLSLFFLLKIPFSEYILLAVLLILVTIDLIKQQKAKRKHKNKEQQKEKIFLLESMIGDTRQGFSGLAFINLFNFLNIIKMPFHTLENHWLLLISFSLTCVILLFYVTGFMMPQKAEELLQETYPEYKMVNNL
ncbi:hypothetical protein MPF19_02070 [Polaribacter sp. Z014]|uniref:hypothetical protein n=1 Tax=unclassified Polaribacter TaxID=196858 RepID=UPI00193B5E02|nr:MULTISPECIES: hypothetical protein [unclassified Polaribacter]MCL7762185.1 hypothetical protein [Polaribacter sp. Z014]QVY64389.1 hypothetical protein JOP69_11480 [Polaribacter sp. Q13]